MALADLTVTSTARRLLPRLVWRANDGAVWLVYLAAGGALAGAILSFTGLPELSTMGPMYSVGLVSPTCGLTRSVVSIASGNFSLAWRFNPAGFLVVAAGAGAILRWLVGRTTGRWLGVSIERWRAVIVMSMVAFAALWAYQQTNADFIINARL